MAVSPEGDGAYSATASAASGAALKRPRRGRKPNLRVAIDQRCDVLVDSRVVAVEPVPLPVREHRAVDEPAVDRRQWQRLERIERLLRACGLWRRDHQHQILDA